MKILLLALIVILSNLVAIEIIEDIKYSGIKNSSIENLNNLILIKSKDKLDLKKIDDSLKKFFEIGNFVNISVDFSNSKVLTFFFLEKEMIYDIEIKNYETDKEHKEIFDLVDLHKGSIFNEFKIEKIKNIINTRLQSKGYYDNYINIIFNRKNKQLKIIFDVSKGKNIIISKIDFIGAKKIKKKILIKNLANKAKDTFGWMPGRHNGNALLDHFELDRFRLKDIYMQEGYLDVYIKSSIMKVNTAISNSNIHYTLDEGNIYKVNSLKIENLKDNYKNEIDRSKILTYKGAIFNSNKIREDIKYIYNKISNLGFAYANITPNFYKTDNKLVDIVYKISYNEKIIINDVIISGNSVTQDNVVRRYITLSPTDIYNLSSFENTKSALMRTGYFSDVIILKERIDENHININVKVKEAPTGSIKVGGGYGTYNGLLFNATLSDLNIFGTGISTGIGVNVSKKVLNYSFNISNPRFMDSKYSLSFNVSKTKSQYTTYTQNNFNIGASFGKNFTNSIYSYIGYNFNNNNIDVNESNNITSGYKSAFTGEDIKYIKSSINIGLKYNNTDSFYFPREGVILNNYITYNGVGGDEKFIKYTSRYSLYYGLKDIINYDLILRYKGQIDFLQDIGRISLPEKLFIGGIRSVRGFDPFSISPFKKEGNLITYLGGTKSFVNSIEASIPISPSNKLRLALFYDYGIIGKSEINELQKASYGFSIEWYSPMGPINLIFPRAINPKTFDRTSNFEFTVGVGF